MKYGYGYNLSKKPARIIKPRVTPIQIAGAAVKAWWSTDDTSKISLSGSEVTSWRDMVANYEVIQATGASRPLYSATSFGGAPGVTSDGVDDELTLAPVPASFPIGNDPGEIWLITSQNAAGAIAGTKIAASYGGAANLRRTIGRTQTVSTNRGEARAGSGTAEHIATEGTIDFTGRHVLRVQFKANGIYLSVDNGPESIVPMTLAGTLADRFRLFASSSPTPTAFWQGTHRDAIISTPLTTDQAIAMWAWALLRRLI